MNLVSLIMQFMGPALVAKLASSLGINNALAQKALTAIVPAILAGILGKSSTPAGAGGLFDILGKMDPGMLGKLAGVIGGGQQKEVATQGNNMLGQILGNSSLGALTGAVSKYTGIGEGPTQGLVGMLAPAVLGTIGQQAKGFDAGGLAKMLMGQKANIQNAMPADFAKLLGGTGLLDGFLPAKPAPTATTAPAASRSTPSASVAMPPVTRAATFNWWPWLAAIALAAIGWWYLFAGPRSQVAMPAAPRVMAGTTDVGGQLETSLKGLQGLLASVKDEQSARTVLPKLRDSQAALDTLASTPGLSADARKAMAGYVASWLPTLTPLLTSLLANTSIGPVLKPVLDTLRTRLEAMAKA